MSVFVAPVLISATRLVPPWEPSDFQSSRPLVPSSATKYKVPFALVRYLGSEKPIPTLISLTSVVPAFVPFDFQSSNPLALSNAEKNTMPFTSARYRA